MVKPISITIALAFLAFALPARAQAVACGTADDTPAIQAAIKTFNHVILPAGTCSVSSLNGTNRLGLVIEGRGSILSQLVPIRSGANVIDLTGSSSVTLRNFRICGFCNQSIIPEIGILSAQMSGSYGSDVLAIENVRVDGNFSLAALYSLAVASSHISWSQFYNYESGAFTAVITGNNFFGADSTFVSIDNSNNHVPSDWTVIGTEFHNFGQGWALWLGGINGIRFYGGNMSSSHAIVSVDAVMIGSRVAYPSNIILDGTTFYSDFAPNAPCAVSGYTPAVSFRQNFIAGMPLTGC